MIVANVQDQIGARLETIDGLRMAQYEDELDEVPPLPAGMVSLPVKVDYHQTMQNGMVTYDMIITVLAGLADSHIRRREIAPYGDDKGPRSIRWVLETGTYDAFDDITVYSGIFTILTIANISYKAFVAQAKVVGSGGN